MMMQGWRQLISESTHLVQRFATVLIDSRLCVDGQIGVWVHAHNDFPNVCVYLLLLEPKLNVVNKCSLKYAERERERVCVCVCVCMCVGGKGGEITQNPQIQHRTADKRWVQWGERGVRG